MDSNLDGHNVGSLLDDDDLARLCIHLLYACLYVSLMAHDYVLI
jgi:hypothetical protein